MNAFENFEKKELKTVSGPVVYWIKKGGHDKTLVFLHGLTADHTLFEKQIPYFEDDYDILVWDAPSHGESRPYTGFNYPKAVEHLKWIFEREEIENPVFIGQSMGGFLTQSFMKRYPGEVKAFVAIDTCPYGEKYPKMEKFLLAGVGPIAKALPERLLKESVARSTSFWESTYKNHLRSLRHYSKKDLTDLITIGFFEFNEESKENVDITCPMIILLGEYDKMGKVSEYSKIWAKDSGKELKIIPAAGHNSNYDNSVVTNETISEFLQKLN